MAIATVLLFIGAISAAAARTVQELQEDYVRECGRPYRSTLGVAVTHGEQPWMVEIYRSDNPKTEKVKLYKGGCEGLLLTDRFVLTTAKCVNGTRNSALRARLGQAIEETHLVEDHKIRRKVVHEGFGGAAHGLINNIALIELAHPVKYRKHVVPICLPRENANPIGKAAVSYRWSEMASLLATESPLEKRAVRIVGDHVCESLIQNPGWNVPSSAVLSSPESSLCVRSKGRPDRSSVPRTGSALIQESEGRLQVVGLFSREAPESSGYAYYVRVPNYLGWINANIKAFSKTEEINAGIALVEVEEHVEGVAALVEVGLAILFSILALLVITHIVHKRYCGVMEKLKRDLAKAQMG